MACSRTKHLPGVNYSFNGVYTALPAFLTFNNATYTRNSLKHVLQNGALVQLAANQFGTSYDPVTGLYGYLPESAATNLALYSDDLSQWNRTRCSVTTNATTAPDGTVTADKIIGTAVAGNHKVFAPVVAKAASAVTYTGSVYVKSGEYNFAAVGLSDSAENGVSSVGINLTTGAITDVSADNGFVGGTAMVENIGSGWWRVSLTCTSNTSTSIRLRVISSLTLQANGDSEVGDGVSGIYVWGAQLETGTYASSYIKTAGATATRAADVLTVPLANVTGFNAAGYTMFYDGRQIVQLSTDRKSIAITDGTASNRAYIALTTSNAYQTLVSSGGAVQANAFEGTAVIERHKRAASVSLNNLLTSINGASGLSDVTMLMPVSPTTLYLGCLNGSAQKNGYIFNAKLITTPLTQSQINAITKL